MLSAAAGLPFEPYWYGWKDALAGFPPQAEEHAEPKAYLTGYEDGREWQVDSALAPRTLLHWLA
jgi:hypothetical protein